MINFSLLQKINISTMAGYIYYLSQSVGCYDDADLSMESASFGTDSTSGIQTILNHALNHPIMVIVDGRFSISDTLKIHSNTTIQGLSGCGFIMKDNVNKQMLNNFNRPTNVSWGSGWTTVDQNIHIDSIILNGNGQRSGVEKQTHDTDNGTGWSMPLRMSGLKNCTFSNIILRNSRTYGAFLNCVDNINIENITLELPDILHGIANYDGWKLDGPATRYTIKNLSGRCHDDIFSICANDGHDSLVNPKAYPILFRDGSSYTSNLYDPSASYGDIDGVLVENVTFSPGSYYAFRILATTNKVSNVIINGVHGVTHAQMCVLDNYGSDPSLIFGNGSVNNQGYYYNIKIFNVDAQQLYTSWADKLSQMYFSGVIDSLEIDGVYRTDMSLTYPLIKTGGTIRNLNIRNVRCVPSNDAGSSVILIYFEGTVQNATLDNITYDRNAMTSINSSVLSLDPSSIHNNIKMSNIITRKCSNILSGSGAWIDNFQATNITHLDSNSGVTFSNSSSTTGADNTVISNVIKDAGSSLLSGMWGGQKGDAFL